MPTDAVPTMQPKDRRLLWAAVAAIVALSLFRLVALWAGKTELSTDEAQYWLWGQTFAFGAYSKPPMIGWIISLSTAVLGEATWAVRAPAPLFHMLTSLVILALGLRVAGLRIAALAALTYITMPAITLGSFLMTTDTPMLAASATALLLQHILASRGRRGEQTVTLAMALGAAVAFGMMTKYAMLFAVAGMCVAALVSSEWRLRSRDVAIAGITALVLMSPNLIWVASNNFVTVQHMAETSGIDGPKFHPMVALRFVAEQFAVFGPIVFAIWLLALSRAGQMPSVMRGLLAASGVVLLIVIGQALMGKALANWAVGFAIGSSLVFANQMASRPRLATVSLAIGGFLALSLPLLTMWGTELRAGDRLVLGRYLGQDDLVAQAVTLAQDQGATILASDHRDILSALSWQARSSGLQVNALPYDGAPRNYWEMTRPLSGKTDQPVLVITTHPLQLECGSAIVANLTEAPAGPGFLEGQKIFMSVVPAQCLASETS